MRLVTWNCQGGFARKHAAIAAMEPDVLVVPEAARVDGLEQVLGASPVNSVEWVGSNPRKGLGVVSYGEYSLRVHEAYDARLRWILPLEVRGPIPFTLVAVWAMPDEDSGRRYAQCVFDACDSYRTLLESPRVVIAGDFNNNVCFDTPRHPLKFASVLSTLESRGLRSLYHVERGCAHGEEPDPTFFLYRRAERRYHIDFIFAKAALMELGFSVTVGDHATWGSASDHMPLACTFGGR